MIALDDVASCIDMSRPARLVVPVEVEVVPAVRLHAEPGREPGALLRDVHDFPEVPPCFEKIHLGQRSLSLLTVQCGQCSVQLTD